MTEGFTKKRFEDLAEKSYKSNCYTFTTFLNESELSLFYEINIALSTKTRKEIIFILAFSNATISMIQCYF